MFYNLTNQPCCKKQQKEQEVHKNKLCGTNRFAIFVICSTIVASSATLKRIKINAMI